MSTSQVIVYHKISEEIDCPDGICAAYFMHNFLKNIMQYPSIEVIGVSHRKEEEYFGDYQLPFNPTEKDVYILDFCFPFNILKEIQNKANSVTILDHHIGNIQNISAFSKILTNKMSAAKYSPNEKDCGATLAWKHCYQNNEYPWFLSHVFARDTGTGGFYDGDMPESEAIGEAMSEMRKGLVGAEAFPVFDRLMNASIEKQKEILERGKELLQPKYEACEQEISHWLENPVFEKIGEFLSVPVLRIQNSKNDRFYSWIGTLLSRRYSDIFVAIITTNRPNGYSLRANSKSQIDCSVIAKVYGGGGHSKAAGFIK